MSIPRTTSGRARRAARCSLKCICTSRSEFERDHIASHAITEEIERRLEAEFGE